MVKLLACGARGPGSIPGLTATISETVNLRFQIAIWLKYRNSDVNPQNKQPTSLPLHCFGAYSCFGPNSSSVKNEKGHILANILQI